jgi:hypothetical protein
MAETIVILSALGLLIAIYAVIVYGVGWLIVATPIMRWGLYGVVAFLALKVVLLPFDHLSIWWSGTFPESTFEEEVRAKTEVTLSTQIAPTRRSGKFKLLAQGSLTNNSDRVIEGITIWCRVPKLGFGDSETARETISVVVRPGETGQFVGEVSAAITGIAEIGHLALQAPDQHFCRIDRLYYDNRT